MAVPRPILPLNLSLSVPAQAVLTGSASALLLGSTFAALFLFATDVATQEPEPSATGKQLRIRVVHSRPPAVIAQPKMAALPPAPRQGLNPIDTVPVLDVEPRAPEPRAQESRPLQRAESQPAEPARGEVFRGTARAMADRRAERPRVIESDYDSAAARIAPGPLPARIAPQTATARATAPPPVRPGRPTDALAEARRAWAARQERFEDIPIYPGEEPDFDPRDDPPPQARRAPQYGRYAAPDPQDRYADDDRYDPYADEPDPYRQSR